MAGLLYRGGKLPGQRSSDCHEPQIRSIRSGSIFREGGGLKFLQGTCDDQVDVLSLFGRVLVETHSGEIEAPPISAGNMHAMTIDQLWEA